MSKTYVYECFGETLSFAESLGWVDWLDDVDDDTDPDTIDAAEGDAIDYIESKGYVVDYGDSSKNDWPYDQTRHSQHSKRQMKMKYYKVWVEIEEIDEEKDSYMNVGEPSPIANFATFEEADMFVLTLYRESQNNPVGIPDSKINPYDMP